MCLNEEHNVYLLEISLLTIGRTPLLVKEISVLFLVSLTFGILVSMLS